MKPCKDITPNLLPNTKVAEDQEEYQTLTAHYSLGPEGALTFALSLDDEELEMLKKNKRLYVTVLTFNQHMQPLLITADPREAESIAQEYTLGGADNEARGAS